MEKFFLPFLSGMKKIIYANTLRSILHSPDECLFFSLFNYAVLEGLYIILVLKKILLAPYNILVVMIPAKFIYPGYGTEGSILLKYPMAMVLLLLKNGQIAKSQAFLCHSNNQSDVATIIKNMFYIVGKFCYY